MLSTAQDSARPRVLIGAYACGPGDEPEAAAGWAFAIAAAVNNDVWVVTRTRFIDGITRALDARPELRDSITVVPLDLSSRTLALKRGRAGVYWYYMLWQRALRRRARELHQQIGFDVAHHVTFANDWLPCGLADLGVPLVWGPVGGASRMPLRRVWRWLGPRGLITELVRIGATGVPRLLWGDRTARRASVVVAQNDDVGRRFRRATRVVIEPNAAFVASPRPSSPADQPTALFVARLLAWKGGRIALEALADPRLQTWRLEIFGTGYELEHLQKRARRLGIADRVTFHGHRPRAEVLEAHARATALVFPSMHDQAGWAAAEASASGVPVVCLPLGGPPLLAERNAVIVPLDGDLARGTATALLEAGRRGGTPHQRWSPSRLTALVDDWYATARAGNR